MSDQRADAAGKAINVGLASNIVLAAAKTAIGIFGHSEALLADGINSISDVTYYIVVKVCMHLAGKPPDAEHPYGHRQLESIAALIVGAFVITTGIAIFWDAVSKVYDVISGREESSTIKLIALWVALITVLVKLALTAYTRRVGRRTANPAILALAYDHRNDIFSAIGASIGITVGRLGVAWADPLVAAFVAVLVFKTGVAILKDSSAELMDTVPGDDIAKQVEGVLGKVKGVLAVEEVLAHHFGPYLVLNVTIGIDGGLTVAEGDEIASSVETSLFAHIPFVRRTHVHYHPAHGVARRLMGR